MTITDRLRCRPLLLQLEAPFKVLLLLPVVNDLLVLIAHDFPLLLHQLHLLLRQLVCAHVVCLDHLAAHH